MLDLRSLVAEVLKGSLRPMAMCLHTVPYRVLLWSPKRVSFCLVDVTKRNEKQRNSARTTASRHRQVTDLDVTVLGFSGPGSQRAQRSKNSRFRSGLKISSENEIFERATHRGPICGGGNRDVKIEIFERDQKFWSRLKFLIGIKFFWSLGPLGLPSARHVLCGDAPRLFCVILVCI